jgi:type II secretory pathway predicted ATPase ExeA
VYTDFYNLKEAPFKLTPSPRFLYLGKSHEEALALLTYGVMERKGFILLTGDVGTGKTTMIRALLSNLDSSVQCISLPNPLLSPKDFMDYLAFSAFKKRVHFRSRAAFLLEFEGFLRECLHHQKNFILIIDEAQRLSFALLEEIRLLSNMEYANEKLMNIFLVGQPELNGKLSEPRCQGLLERISNRYHIPPLDFEGTRGYLATRLKIAGAKREDEIFSKGAVDAIHHYSLGYPRVINILADNSLLLGYSEGKRTITAPMVTQCYEDMSLKDAFPKNGGRTPEPYETKKVGKIHAGRLWKWAAALFLMVALVAMGMSQRGRGILWEILGFKQAPHQVFPDRITKQQLLTEKKENGKTGGPARNKQASERVSANEAIEAQEAQPIKILEPHGLNEKLSPLNRENKGTASSLTVEEGVICRDVYQRKPLIVGSSFEASVGTLYCFTKIVGARSPIEITHVWYFGNTERARVSLAVRSSTWRTYSSKVIQSQDIGNWHVDVLGPEGEVLRTLRFKIT